MYPEDYKYSKDHEWVRIEDDICVIGITDYAQDELGEVVFVELPEAGQSFDAHDEIGSIESVKAVAEVYTPVGGEVVEVNETLEEAPETVNKDPHGEGWLVKIRVASTDELGELMDVEAYQNFLDSGE
jgi:glycine cleavage system H protein